MNLNTSKTALNRIQSKRRRGVAEVISTLLMVVITVVGAVILTGFIDESFVSGSLAVTSGTDVTIKKIKLTAYDTRNGNNLMSDDYLLNNTQNVVPEKLCRESCAADTIPQNGGSNFIFIQIENRNVNPIFLKGVVLEKVVHSWDSETSGQDLDFGSLTPAGGVYPIDGSFSVLSSDTIDQVQKSNQIQGGETVNVLLKLDTANDDIELSKSMRVQLNIGESSLAEFLIETGDAR